MANVFFDLLWRYCKLVILGTLDMPGYWHPKWHYQTVENICLYLQTKNQLHLPCFSGDIAKICKHLILGTLAMFGYLHQKWYNQLVENFDVYLHDINKFHHSLLYWDITF